MRWRRWPIALVPAAAGLAASSLLSQVPALPNPIIAIRVDVGTAVFLTGCALSLAAVFGVTCWDWAERRCQGQLADIRTEATEERRRFLQRLDHELKNPLTAIRVGLANLSGDPPAGARDEALTSVEAEVLRLSRLTSDLRKLAELETRPLEEAAVDAAELLEEVVAVAQEQPAADGRRLALALPQAPWPVPTIQGDRDLLFLALYNLLDNALKFTHLGDTVEVRAFEDGNVVVIEVADTGPGIPQDEIPRVWEELYRGRDARGVPGSGLGLALVRAVAERHDGQVSVRSRVGQGTVVRMTLPVR
ncbi:MAG: HAMP domain-containing sensor histidine kinase [Anaerolineae bacterium]|jgi:two-component system OmpR family sensor kinase